MGPLCIMAVGAEQQHGTAMPGNSMGPLCRAKAWGRYAGRQHRAAMQSNSIGKGSKSSMQSAGNFLKVR